VTYRGGDIDGVPLRVSQYLANNGGSGGAPFILVDEAEIYLADDGAVTLDATDQASLEMSDAPTQEQALLGLLNQIWGDPEVGEQVRPRAKALNPAITKPDEHPVVVGTQTALRAAEQRVSALETLMAEQAAKANQTAEENRLRTSLGKAQERFKLTDEGLAGTIELMQSRQIADPEAAAALYVDGLPKQKPSTGSNFLPSNKLNLFGTSQQDAAWEQLHTDPDQFFADTVNRIVSDPAYG
jgi:hypothetical protein